jgi:hypothetical protein
MERLRLSCQAMLLTIALLPWHWAVHHLAMPHEGPGSQGSWHYEGSAYSLFWCAFLALACLGAANFAGALALRLFSSGLYRWAGARAGGMRTWAQRAGWRGCCCTGGQHLAGTGPPATGRRSTAPAQQRGVRVLPRRLARVRQVTRQAGALDAFCRQQFAQQALHVVETERYLQALSAGLLGG